LVAAAAKLGQPIDLLVVGGDASVAGAAAQLDGIGKVLVAYSMHQHAEALTQLLISLAENYSHIAAASSATGRDVLPRLAAKLDIMPVTDVIAVHDPQRFDRPVYAGNAIETVTTAQARTLLTFRISAFDPVAANSDAPIEEVTENKVESAVRLIEEFRTQSDTAELGTARIVVGGGVSFGSKENFALAEKLARRLGAAIGATRAAVDAGYAPNDWQVGQTGKTIAPDLYIAIGISGALQHLAGIGGAKKIIAINSDPEAPLVKLADLSLIGDLFEIVPALTEALDKRLPLR
jgi:electron transfer flavoprotein alpha subunit